MDTHTYQDTDTSLCQHALLAAVPVGCLQSLAQPGVAEEGQA